MVLRFQRGGGFTLIELIFVMAMLLIVLSVSAPSLSRFFRGQSLNGEARRFLALTRLGQSRATSEGLPLRLWIDAKEGRYGLAADASYAGEDQKALEFELNEDLRVEVDASVSGLKFNLAAGSSQATGNLPAIRFTPDGFIGEDSPMRVLFREGRMNADEEEDKTVQIGQSQNRLYYEIQTNILQLLRR